MRRSGLLLVAALLCPALLPGQTRVDAGWAIDSDASIRITVPHGSVRIVGSAVDSVRVTGRIAAGGGSFYGGGSGQAAKLGVEQRPGGTAAGAILEVRVPARARVWVKTETAAVLVEGLTGEMDLLSVTGALEVRGEPAVVTAESLDGDITTDTRGGVLRLRGGGGRVTAQSVGGDVTAVTVGGAVLLVAERLGRGRVESVNGAITFRGGLAPGASLSAETHGADVLLQFAGEVNAEFSLASVAGGVVNQLDARPVVMDAKGKPVTFVVGTGGAQVTARTFKGTVTLSR